VDKVCLSLTAGMEPEAETDYSPARAAEP
jgi:hypothetical protein